MSQIFSRHMKAKWKTKEEKSRTISLHALLLCLLLVMFNVLFLEHPFSHSTKTTTTTKQSNKEQIVEMSTQSHFIVLEMRNKMSWCARFGVVIPSMYGLVVRVALPLILFAFLSHIVIIKSVLALFGWNILRLLYQPLQKTATKNSHENRLRFCV